MFGALGLTALVFLDATPGQMGVLAMAQGLPALLFALVAGVMVDRLPRRPVLIVADFGRFAALLTVPAAALLDALTIEQLYLVAFVVGALDLAFNVAYRSYLPALVSREQLLDANARLSATESIAESGSAAGGFIVQFASGPIAVLVDAFTFLTSGLLVRRIRRPEPPVPPQPDASVLREAREGIGEVMSNSILRALTGSRASMSFFGAFFAALYTIFLIRELGFSPFLTGVTITAGGLGSFAGALVVGRVTRRLGIGPTMPVSSLGVQAWLIPLAGGPSELALAVILISQVFGDPFWTMYEIGAVSLRQSVTEERMLGRVSSAMHLVEAGLLPIGAITAGLLAEAIGVRETLGLAAIGISSAALWIALSPIPKLRTVPPQQT
jgi:predicted MFS family arabinose efflux permease